MKIYKTEFPKNSILQLRHQKYDYVDSYQGVLMDKGNKITSVDVAKAFFAYGPKWVGTLFILRNKIVSIFGLKTGGEAEERQKQLDDLKFNPNDRIGLFKVFSKTENEVVLGEDDKHLNFRISLLIENIAAEPTKKKITISTTVEFHNSFGKLYFLPVKPFHKLIVPQMLASMIEELEKRD